MYEDIKKDDIYEIYQVNEFTPRYFQELYVKYNFLKTKLHFYPKKDN